VNPINIIDFHTHYYPSSVSADPIRFSVRYGEDFWRQLVVPENKRSLQGWVTEQRRLEHMNEAGIAKSVLLGWYWEQPEACALQNQSFVDLKSRHPDSFEAFAAIHPPSIKETKEQLQFALDHGFKGIGEIHPAVQGFRLMDCCWTHVVEFAIEHNLLINLHVTEPVGRLHYPREDTLFRDIQWLVEQYPEMRLVLSHWGGLVFMHELNPYIAKRWQNVYYDTSASPLLYDDRLFQIAIDAISPEKFLFGSDYPLMVYPKKQKDPDLISFVSRVKAAVKDPVNLEKLFRGNAEALLG
jgi:uncharacterized protein